MSGQREDANSGCSDKCHLRHLNVNIITTAAAAAAAAASGNQMKSGRLVVHSLEATGDLGHRSTATELSTFADGGEQFASQYVDVSQLTLDGRVVLRCLLPPSGTRTDE